MKIKISEIDNITIPLLIYVLKNIIIKVKLLNFSFMIYKKEFLQ